MNKPLVSIIVPCYQSGQTLERTISSMKAQTVKDWELIAVDDGSKDDTWSVLQRLAEHEPRMRIVHQENAGVSAARNAGMEIAQGEWLSFVDADDHLLPHALEHLLSLMDADTDIVCGAYEIRFADQDGKIEKIEKHGCADGDLQTVLESLIRGDSALNSMCARLYRREMIEKQGIRAPKGVKVGEDVLFNLDAFMAARAWRMSEETIYIYELGGDSAMTRSRGEMFARNRDMLIGIGRFGKQHGMETQLFRAHVDVYVRMLRADKGRLGAALAMDRSMVAAMTEGVAFAALSGKQKLYYAALKILPFSSVLLP